MPHLPPQIGLHNLWWLLGYQSRTRFISPHLCSYYTTAFDSWCEIGVNHSLLIGEKIHKPLFSESTHKHAISWRVSRDSSLKRRGGGGRKNMRRGKSGLECCLVPPDGNERTSVTQMTVRVAGLFVWPLVHCDRLDRQGGWRLCGNEGLHFHSGEKSGWGG